MGYFLISVYKQHIAQGAHLGLPWYHRNQVGQGLTAPEADGIFIPCNDISHSLPLQEPLHHHC